MKHSRSIAITLIVLSFLLTDSLAVASHTGGKKNRETVSGYTFLRPGTYSVETVEYNWHDNARNRIVPVKIYFPAKAAGPFPVIIFSHGLGGSREGYTYLGEYWASHGFISVHPTHSGSDSRVWKDARFPMQALKRAAENPVNAVNRFKDISFIINKLYEINNTKGTFKGKLNLNEIGVGGHSFGAHTVLGVTGKNAILPNGRRITFRDKRIKAAIAMSPPAREFPSEKLNEIYGDIRIPFFVMTGTKDNSPFLKYDKGNNNRLGKTKAADRRIPFDHMKGPSKYLLILKGGDHKVFSGRLRKVAGRNDEAFEKFVCYGSTAFWDAYLKHDIKAKQWLSNGGYKRLLGKQASFEEK